MRNYFLMHIIKYSRVRGAHRRDSRLGSARGHVTVTAGKETYRATDRPSVSVGGEFERKIYASDRSARRCTVYLNSPLKFLITSWTLYFSRDSRPATGRRDRVERERRCKRGRVHGRAARGVFSLELRKIGPAINVYTIARETPFATV